MKVVSLEELDAPVAVDRSDVCIIGAGAAGLYLGSRLIQEGLRVVILEAGSHVCVPGKEVGIEAECPSSEYGGVTKGRAFGLGGSTSAWGGVLIPFPEQDRRPSSDKNSDAWARIIKTVQQRAASVARHIGVAVNPSEPISRSEKSGNVSKKLKKIGISLGAATWLPFRRRNFSFLVDASKAKNAEAIIYINAVACDWHAQRADAEGAHIEKVEARSAGGRRLVVKSDRFVISAGAVESTRILKEIDTANGSSIIRTGAAVGHYLSDHLSCRIAEVRQNSAQNAIRTFGPRFQRGCMRSFRFVESNPSGEYPRFFAHLLFDNENPGFQLARQCLQGWQSKRFPKLSLVDIWRGSGGLVSLAYGRVIRKKLFIPRVTPVYLQVDIEQEARYENIVTLGEETDKFGRQKAVVNWKIGSADCHNIENVAQKFGSRWQMGRGFLPEIETLSELNASIKPYDVYHPVGTCRMGMDSEAVVDWTLKVHGSDNLYVVSTAVFPSAGSANPTFSMLCLADRLADHLISRAGGSI